MNKLILKAKTLKSKLIPIGICLFFGLLAVAAMKSVTFQGNGTTDGNWQPAEEVTDLAADTARPQIRSGNSQSASPASRISEDESQRFQPIGQGPGSRNSSSLTWIGQVNPKQTPRSMDFTMVDFGSPAPTKLEQPDSRARTQADLDELLSIGQQKAERTPSVPDTTAIGSISQVSMTSEQLDNEFESSLPAEHGKLETFANTDTSSTLANGRIRTPRRQIHQIPNNVEQRIQQHLEYGRALARRGSVYSATNEFIHGLKLIAQVWDYQASTTEFSQSLNHGLVATEELKDFLVTDTNVRRGRHAYDIIRGHATKAFTSAESRQVTTIQALQRYMRFSQESLADAAGNEPIASKIYYAWGKLHLTLAAEGEQTRLNQARATVLFRAAFAVDTTNSLAANELAVMLARNGNLDVAKDLLVQSLSASPLPVGWKNLSSIHKKLGEPELAQLAWNEFRIMTATEQDQQIYSSTVQWVSPQQFRQINGAFGYPDEKETTNVKSRQKKSSGTVSKWNRHARSGLTQHWGAKSNSATSRARPVRSKGFGYATQPAAESEPAKKSAKKPGFIDKLKSIF